MSFCLSPQQQQQTIIGRVSTLLVVLCALKIFNKVKKRTIKKKQTSEQTKYKR